jgi:hypothetical protein
VKLKDFLKEFEGVDPEADMIFQMADGCCSETFDLGDPYVDHYNFPGGSYCSIDFPALDFLSSCIRSGIAKDAVKRHLETLKKFHDKKD